MKRICIGLVGDFSEKMLTHVALNNAIEHCRNHLDFRVEASWISTTSLIETIFEENRFQGFWIAPGSPYRDDSAVYQTIRWARENDFPILGSCGGFQYMVVEYARNVLGFLDARHEESDPEASHKVITKLSCSLKGGQENVFITDRHSWLYKVLKTEKFTGYFFCSYGVNPADQSRLNQPPFSFTAFSTKGEARAFELRTHRFFKGTLFQPSLDSTAENPNLLMLDFFRFCANQDYGRKIFKTSE
jgi:CTP synthase (UTP-ammonia lyase)